MKGRTDSFSHSPATAHAWHDSSRSMQTVVHTPHAAGHMGMTTSGFLWHSAALAQMSHCVVLKSWHSCRALDLQASHECGQVMYMCAAFVLHSPPAVQPGQSEWMSLQVEVHVLHVTGQFLSMNSGLVVHWSKRISDECQSLQSGETSLHKGEQMPQLVGQMESIDCLFVSHSPSRAHAGQESSLSLQSNSQVPHEMGQCEVM
mmetsp:Transcript_11316/g.28649  ORF Transcript_11316/g.28649 Transcript_11316/m.28649 type:complete len:203 (+) Transcript_11316:479-1087(+)